MALSLIYSYSGYSAECYIWECKKPDENSKFYIHKWRVPTPLPMVIEVTFNFKGNFEVEKVISEYEFKKTPELLLNPIVTTVRRVSFHSKTIRFDTDSYERPFPTIYIPYFIFNGRNDDEIIQIVVHWNKTESNLINQQLFSK